MKTIKTKHNLQFEVAPWSKDFSQFRVGTVEGLYRVTKESYEILAIANSKIGNGHIEDVWQWFEASCKRDRKSLKVLEVWNKRFANYLTKKRGFTDIGNFNYEKKI